MFIAESDSISVSSDESTKQSYDGWTGTYRDRKKANIFRVLFHNVNSLRGKNAYSDSIPTLINDQVNLGIDCQCITEHCLNISFQNTDQLLQQSIRRSTNTKICSQFNSSPTVTSTEYLPGGTAMILTGPTVGRIIPNGKGGDSLGRWTYMSFRRRHCSPVTIISAYQVNKQPTNEVGITAWHQQRLLLDKAGRTDIHPRKAFIDDLIEFIKSRQAETSMKPLTMQHQACYDYCPRQN
jgi:hypothetical protein